MRLNNLSFFDFLWNAWTWIATCVWVFFGCECHDYLICFEATILVTNLETLVWFSPSPMLIWVLQSSQCSKICMAQHWGRRGAHLRENKGVRSEIWRKFKTNGSCFNDLWRVLYLVGRDEIMTGSDQGEFFGTVDGRYAFFFFCVCT